MGRSAIASDNTVFVVLSFEGPDRYSLAGGLGVRVINLAGTLAGEGFPIHFFFVGDPRLKGEEATRSGKAGQAGGHPGRGVAYSRGYVPNQRPSSRKRPER